LGVVKIWRKDYISVVVITDMHVQCLVTNPPLKFVVYDFVLIKDTYFYI